MRSPPTLVSAIPPRRSGSPDLSTGIPTAFIVGKDGKVAWIGHPMSMSEPLAMVIAGNWNTAAAAKFKTCSGKPLGPLKLSALTKVGGTVENTTLTYGNHRIDSVYKANAQALNSFAWGIVDPASNKKIDYFSAFCRRFRSIMVIVGAPFTDDASDSKCSIVLTAAFRCASRSPE